MKYIKGYDTLRAISIILVVISHLGLYDWLPDNEFIRNRAFLLFSGSTGVQIFFVLSGFLITRILLQERDKTGTLKLKNFYIRRFLRLLPPLAIFYTIILVCMLMRVIPVTSVGFLMSVTYTYNFVPLKFYTTELGHTWSLAVEEQFYLMWPILLLLIRNTKKMLSVIGLIVAACIAMWYYLPDMIVTIHNNPVKLGDVYHVGRWFIPAVAPIMIGSAAAIITNAYYDRLSQLFKGKNAILIVALVLYSTALFIPEFLLVINPVFMSTGVALFLIWLFYNQETKTASILEFKPATYIGRISYGLYVYHGIFVGTAPSDSLYVKTFPINVILTFIFAVLSFEFVEKPILKLKNRFR